jgi:hypothetical protein
MKSLTVLAATVLMLGCSIFGSGLSVDFRILELHPGTPTDSVLSVTTGIDDGTFRIEGLHATSHCTSNRVVTAELLGRTVDVRLKVRTTEGSGGICNAGVSYVRYEAIVRGLEAGTYPVEVWYERPEPSVTLRHFQGEVPVQ